RCFSSLLSLQSLRSFQLLPVALVVLPVRRHSDVLEPGEHRLQEAPRGPLASFAGGLAIPVREAGAATVDLAGARVLDHLAQQLLAHPAVPDVQARPRPFLARDRGDEAEFVRG